ncbi:hypothetical protein LHJ74_21050 [Streptomyces sp. N2-109]|uniref:Uncharacterized protein n=1 Tax=Streptomyces gossypii TaxID=2883101 RepID=A0ABT2JWT9_9ACTN|nr:hypothetical protein [Streptomyces gossypii]MCT2592362.1 hypothetical protein [Streptomyces gossypii]
MTTGTAPKDELDAAAAAGVNGPEGDFFTASKDGDLAGVGNLQKMMLLSLSSTLVSCAGGAAAAGGVQRLPGARRL